MGEPVELIFSVASFSVLGWLELWYFAGVSCLLAKWLGKYFTESSKEEKKTS